MTQHRLSAPIVRAADVARVTNIAILLEPGPGSVMIYYALGEVVGGAFVETSRDSIALLVSDLPAQMQATLTTLTTRAVAALVARGSLPAGTAEPIPGR